MEEIFTNDLIAVFGEKATEFSEELRSLMLELWLRGGVRIAETTQNFSDSYSSRADAIASAMAWITPAPEVERVV